MTQRNTEFSPDKWNELSIDVSDWGSRGAATSFNVSFAAIGTTYPNWVPTFQIDDMGYFTG